MKELIPHKYQDNCVSLMEKHPKFGLFLARYDSKINRGAA